MWPLAYLLLPTETLNSLSQSSKSDGLALFVAMTWERLCPA